MKRALLVTALLTVAVAALSFGYSPAGTAASSSDPYCTGNFGLPHMTADVLDAGPGRPAGTGDQERARWSADRARHGFQGQQPGGGALGWAYLVVIVDNQVKWQVTTGMRVRERPHEYSWSEAMCGDG